MSIWNSAFSVPTSPFFRQVALLSSSKTACMDEKFLCSIMPTYYVPVLKSDYSGLWPFCNHLFQRVHFVAVLSSREEV